MRNTSASFVRELQHDCAVSASILLLAGLPSGYFMVQADDAPGLMLIGMILAAAPLAIAIFASVIQRVLHQAIEIKSENDSTI